MMFPLLAGSMEEDDQSCFLYCIFVYFILKLSSNGRLGNISPSSVCASVTLSSLLDGADVGVKRKFLSLLRCWKQLLGRTDAVLADLHTSDVVGDAVLTHKAIFCCSLKPFPTTQSDSVTAAATVLFFKTRRHFLTVILFHLLKKVTKNGSYVLFFCQVAIRT